LTRYRYGSLLRSPIFTLLKASLLSILLLNSVVGMPSIQMRFVPVSSQLSIEIVGVYTTDTNGTNMTTFRRGQTIIVWVAVRNSGSDLDLSPLGPITWTEVVDPRNAPLTIQLHISVLLGGRRVTREGFSVLLGYGPGLTDIPLGMYKASGFVSDKMISQGGSFFAPQVSTTFEVSS